MKKIIFAFIMSCIFCTSFAQIIDVSTGLGTIGQNDINWKVSPSSNSGSTFIIPQRNNAWQSTPVAGTNANWVSVSAAGVGSGQTTFIYERKIQVSSNRNNLKCNFQVAVDDVLKKVELVQPNSLVINIPFTRGNYMFSNQIAENISCPLMGEWKLRITVFCHDPLGTQAATALLVSGNINLMEGNCIEEPALPQSTCCPPWNKDILGKSMQYKGTGGISDPYTLIWNPSALFQSQMQAYLNYIGLLNQCVTRMSMEFRLHNQGNGATPNMGGWGPMIGSIGYASFTKNTTGVSTLSNLPAPISFFPSNAMAPNTWYAITTGIYHDCGKQFFGKDCAENTIYVRVQFMAARGSSSEGNGGNILEISDGKKIVRNIPLM